MSPVIGLVGGVAAGKSTVARFMATLGATVLDCDDIARHLVDPGEPGWAEVIGAFGPQFVCDDGALNRATLGALVFSEPPSLLALNALLHPKLVAEVDRLSALARAQGARAIAVDAAVLIEGGLWRGCDHVVLVSAAEPIRVSRLAKRNGLEPAEALRRIQAQTPEGVSRQYASFVIDTSAGTAATAAQAALAMRRLAPVPKEG